MIAHLAELVNVVIVINWNHSWLVITYLKIIEIVIETAY
jgi:hypothetical protein